MAARRIRLEASGEPRIGLDRPQNAVDPIVKNLAQTRFNVLSCFQTSLLLRALLRIRRCGCDSASASRDCLVAAPEKLVLRNAKRFELDFSPFPVKAS
jgi:hypothetical protein